MKIKSNGYTISGSDLMEALRNNVIGLTGLRITDGHGAEMDFYEIGGVNSDSLIIIHKEDRTDLLLNKSSAKQMIVRIATADLIEVLEDIKRGTTEVAA